MVVSDEIDIEDMDVEEAGPPVTRTTAGEGGDPDFDLGWDETPLRYTYPCRCGDRYEVDGEDLHEDFDFVDVPCASCSLFTRVRYVQADE